jgi:hypothetical protein
VAHSQRHPSPHIGAEAYSRHARHKPATVNTVICLLKIEESHATRLLNSREVTSLLYVKHDIIPDPPTRQETRLRGVHQLVERTCHPARNHLQQQLEVTTQQRDRTIALYFILWQGAPFV